MQNAYPLEDIRQFVIKRSWFTVGKTDPAIVTQEEYEMLKARTLALPSGRCSLMRAYIKGYLLFAKS